MADFTARLAASIAGGTYRGPGAPALEGPALAGAAADWAILDVGCGNGLLLHALAQRGYAASAMPPSRQSWAYARSRGAEMLALASFELALATASAPATSDP